MNDTYRRCNKCIMDTTDPDIEFDDNGVCDHCKRYDEMVKKYVSSGEEGEKKLYRIIQSIKEYNRSEEYNCIIGLSGGVDSSFVAYKVKQYGLRPLAIHLDNGSQ